MLLERPVVAAAVGGLIEIIEHEHTGLLYPPGDSSALADAINRLLDDPDLRSKIVVTGKRRVLERYSLKAYAGAVQSALQASSKELNPVTAMVEFAAALADDAPIKRSLPAQIYPSIRALLRKLKRRMRRTSGWLRRPASNDRRKD
jgi:hypothetical protein